MTGAYLSIELPFPPSLHSKDADLKRFFRNQVDALLAGQTMPKTKLAMFMHCYGSWMTDAGEIRRRDCDNLEKPLKDALFAALGLDDKHEFRLVRDKRESDREYIWVILYELGTLPEPGN